jgi:hypothetical protein
MATARELLEQVDALMRRNREEAKTEIPVLTDAVEVNPPVADPVPVLTDVVDAIDAPTVQQPEYLDTPTVEQAEYLDSPSVAQPDYVEEPSHDPEPSTNIDVAAETVTPVDSRADAARWELLAEDIRMQVLQRIDIFTDTGLQEQLKARLQPIVDDASTHLVATINQHVGQLLRAYVAEAIEREIEKWRQGSK